MSSVTTNPTGEKVRGGHREITHPTDGLVKPPGRTMVLRGLVSGQNSRITSNARVNCDFLVSLLYAGWYCDQS